MNGEMNHAEREVITIVSGLPRSGTSMMMRMLEAGGIEVLTDNVRTADADNPRGYYEFERVKQIEHDHSWLQEARGKAVKMISALLRHLPSQYAYKVIFMQREMDEILASQREMLIRRGEPSDTVSDERMASLFRAHLAQVQTWLAAQPHIDTLYISYNEVVKDPPGQAERVSRFLDSRPDAARMAGAVERQLYRQRRR